MDIKLNKKILISSDHAGFDLKNKILSFLKEKGYEVADMGPQILDKEDDYPLTISPLAFKVASSSEKYFGIVIGKSGQGEAMVCNRYPGIRAMVYYGQNKTGNADQILKLSREHNDANIISLGADFITEEEAKEAILTWLQTPFSNEEKHIRRNGMLDSLE